MADEINVVISRREAIKPCSPTPQHLRSVKLSLLDQIMPDMYVPIILFYPSISNNSHPKKPTEIASERLQHLRETLSKALALFYPFAGRVRDNLFIDCNDEGADFAEAKAGFPMSRILKKPDLAMLKNFLAADPKSSQESHGGCLLLVLATIFECGGVALGLSFSHKISDACTIGGFIRSWAKIAHGNNPELLIKPEYGKGCDLFPSIDSLSFDTSSMELVQDKCLTRRFVFTAEKIAALKKIAASKDHVQSPTRVEAVSGLLWKCILKASAKRLNNLGSPKTSIWNQAMNIRKRIVPPFGDNFVGNLVWGFSVKMDHHDQEAFDLQVLVDKLRKGIEEAKENYSNREDLFRAIQGTIAHYRMQNNEIDSYNCSSWSRFGFYEADFGWEKPIWVSAISGDYKNTVLLIDTRDANGIEGWLTFKEEDMASIESNQELLAFASPNPSVV